MMSIQDIINQPFAHADILQRLASRCIDVTVNTGLDDPAIAMLRGRPKTLAFHINEPSENWANALRNNRWTDIRKLDVLAFETDFLYTANSNSYKEAKAILDNCDNVAKFIAFQHTIPFAVRGSDRRVGLANAFFEFNRDRPDWRPIYRSSANWGVIIFSRDPEFFVDGVKWEPRWFDEAELDRQDEQRRQQNVFARKERNDREGREHWRRLHLYAINVASWNTDHASKWYAEWCDGIPNNACDCRKHWQELTEQNPPDFLNRRMFFRWTIDRHNDVNAKLKKRKFELLEALELYGYASC